MKNFLLLLFMIITTMVDAQTVFKPSTLIIGKGSDVDMSYVVDRAGSADPFLKWNATTGKWCFSNDSVTCGEMVDKTYVDSSVAAATIPDADAVTKGKIQLAGDLSGTAAAPTVPALALKAPLASPALTGVPTAPTATAGTNTTQIATTAYVESAVASATPADATTSSKGIVQLAGDLAGTATAPTVPGLALKAPLASPTFTGTPAAPTATAGTNTTQLATTAFVATAVTAATDPTKISGPASAADEAIVRYDGTTGKLAQNSSASINDSGDITANSISASNTSTTSSLSGLQINNRQITATAGGNLDLQTSDSTGVINFKKRAVFNFKKLHAAYNDPTTGSGVTLEDHTTAFVRLTASANLVSIGGIPAGNGGDLRTVENITGASVTILNDYASATAANRIYTGTGGNIKIRNNSSIQIQYDITQQRWFVVSGVSGTSGLTRKKVWFLQDFEGANNADFATLTGWALNTSSPLNGDVDLKVTHATSSTTYTIKQGSIPVPNKAKEKNNTIVITAKSSATAGNLVLDAGCATDTDLLSSESLDFSSLSGGNEAFASFNIPSTCSNISYTVRALAESGPPVSSIDDISIGLSEVEVMSALVQDPDTEILATGAVSYGSTNTMIPFYPTITSKGDALIAVSSSVLGTSFVATRDTFCTISGSSVTSASTTNFNIGVTVNTTQPTTAVYAVNDGSVKITTRDTVNTASTLSKLVPTAWAGTLSEGDVLRVHGDGQAMGGSTVTVACQGSLKQVIVNKNQKIKIPTSEVRIEGSSSKGSVATDVVKFDTVSKVFGDGLLVASDTSNGTTITVKKNGIFWAQGQIQKTTSNTSIGITKNQLVLTGFSPSASETIVSQQTNGLNSENISATMSPIRVTDGDVFRLISNTTPTANVGNNFSAFFMEDEVQVSVSNTLPQFSENDIVVKARNNSGQAITAAVTDIPFTMYEDTDGLWDGDSFTVPEDGVYTFNGMASFNATLARLIAVYVNGVLYKYASDSITQTLHKFQITDKFLAGQVVSFRSHSNGGTLFTTSGDANHTLAITKVGKPNVTDVDVTPFVNFPVMETQSSHLYSTATFGNAVIIGAMTRQKGSTDIFSYNASTGIYTVLKDGNFVITISGKSAAAAAGVPYISVDSVIVSIATTLATANSRAVATYTERLTAGQTFFVANGSANTINETYVSVLATATPASNISTIDSFNSDTTSFVHKTTAVTSTDPVGTFSTYSFATSTNTKTVCPTAPSQSLTSMNSDGFLIYTRAYNAASTCGNPARVEIQIGKNLKGTELALYKSAAKTTSGNLDKTNPTSTNEQGMSYRGYDETTGILYLDSGSTTSTANTTNNFLFSDGTVQTSGYVVINASKNPSFIADNQGSAIRKIGFSEPIKFSYKFGGVGSITAPTVCAATPCTEYSDKAGVIAPPTRAAAGVYQLVVANGTFEPSVPVDLTCQSFAASAVKIDCDFYNNGNQTLTTNSSGGLTIGISTTTPAGVATDTFISVTVEAE